MRDEAATCRVKLMQPGDTVRWDAFVRTCPQATFFHSAGWQQVIEQAFGHRTWFFYTEEQGEVTGVLPLAEMKSRLFGHALVSLPFCVYGGVAADSGDARAKLLAAAGSLAVELGVGHLELRSQVRMFAQDPSWCGRELYYTFQRAIGADNAANLQAIPRKQRAVVRKAIAHGLASRVDSDAARFFPLFARSMHRLGTPVFPRRYIELLQEVFGRDCEVLVVEDGGRPVSGVLSFYFRDQVIPYYAGAADAARACGANDFMYWRLMEDAAARGCRLFDFGRSKAGTGAFDFKKNWGFTPEPLGYEYKLFAARSLPDNQPLNPRYRALIATWKRLPLPLANLIGPVVARHLG